MLKKPIFNIKPDLFILGLIYIFLILYTLFKGQDINWDLQNYHMYTGYALYNWRFDYDNNVADGVTYFNPIGNFISYIITTKLIFPLNVILITAYQLTIIPILFKIISVLFPDYKKNTNYSIYFILLFCLLSPIWLSLLGTTLHNAWTTPLVLLSILLLIQIDNKTKKINIFLMSFLIGIAVGLKLTNAIYVFPLFACCIYIFKNNFGNFFIKGIIIPGFGLFVGYLLVNGWWAFYLYDKYESPIFPLYNAILNSPYFDNSKNFRDLRWQFTNFVDFSKFLIDISFGTSKITELKVADFRYFILILLAPFFCFYAYKHKYPKNIKIFLIYFLVAYITWAIFFAYGRYYISLEILMGILLAIMFIYSYKFVYITILKKREVIKIMYLSFIFLILLIFLCIKIPNWGHYNLGWGNKVKFNLNLPQKLKSPSNYLIYGQPLGYLIPFFPNESRFLNLTNNIELTQISYDIARELKSTGQPLRIMSYFHGAKHIFNRLKPLDFDSDRDSLNCSYFSALGKFISCDINFDSQIKVDEVKLNNEIDSFDKTKNILFTDFDKVNNLKKIHFTGCLSSGFYTLKKSGLSNQKIDLIINLGKNISLRDKTKKNDFISSFYVKKNECINELSYYNKQNNLTYSSLSIKKYE